MAAYQHISHGFDPVFDERSHLLVLGSFPSVLSRKNDFYYGNPQNRFWRVIAACAESPVPQTIDEKRAFLLAHGIALWDVIEECDIKGSSDASIKNVVPAQVERILRVAPIGAVICNGGTAGRLYKRFLQYKVQLDACVLPSTSPANAAWGTQRLTDRWRETVAPLLADPPCPPHGLLPEERIRYGAERIAPAASTYSVHRSMQGNKGKDTKPELLVRQCLRAAGLTGYRLQWKAPGRPDIAWPGKRVAVFINGCFWHRCPHCNPSTPRRNVEYWQAKFARNVERDRRNLEQLEQAGWHVHVIWECELKKGAREATLGALLPQLAKELGKQLNQSTGATENTKEGER